MGRAKERETGNQRARRSWASRGRGRAAPGPRGTRGPGGGPSSRRLAPPRGSQQPHSSGFPTHSPSKSPKRQRSRAPPPPGPEQLFFTPSWSLICCGERKRLLLGEGLRGGREGGAAIVCPAAARLGPPGVGAGGARGAGGEGREGRAGPEWGPRGRGMRAGRVVWGEGVEGKATRAHKPIVRSALFCTWPGAWGTMRAHGSGYPGCALRGGHTLGQGATALGETPHAFNEAAPLRERHAPAPGRVPHSERAQCAHRAPYSETHTRTYTA